MPQVSRWGDLGHPAPPLPSFWLRLMRLKPLPRPSERHVPTVQGAKSVDDRILNINLKLRPFCERKYRNDRLRHCHREDSNHCSHQCKYQRNKNLKNLEHLASSPLPRHFTPRLLSPRRGFCRHAGTEHNIRLEPESGCDGGTVGARKARRVGGPKLGQRTISRLIRPSAPACRSGSLLPSLPGLRGLGTSGSFLRPGGTG